MRHLLAPLVVSALLGFAGAAHAQVSNFTTTLSGANEAPPNSSPGTGTASALSIEDFNELRLHADFSGLVAGTTAAHIHCCTTDPETGTAGVATTVPSFVGFPLGVTSGTYDMTFDLLSEGTYNPAFIAAHGGTVDSAEADLLAGIEAGTAYLNIHSSQYPGGEIRGFFMAAPIPSRATWRCWQWGWRAWERRRWRGRARS
jgi:hypothetical protein